MAHHHRRWPCIIIYLIEGGTPMRLKEIRNRKSLSLRALSELSGVSQRTIEDIERFDRCKVDTAIKLADALKVSLDELCRDLPSED
jgi:transcriptional regulator with XRE-family HTH domain